MINFTELAKLYSTPEENSTTINLVRRIERLYFTRKTQWYKPWQRLDEVLFAKDITVLEQSLEAYKVPNNFHSRELQENTLLDKYRNAAISEDEKQLLVSRIVEPARARVTAVMLTEILLTNARQERIKWIIATLLGLLIALLGSIAKIAGT